MTLGMHQNTARGAGFRMSLEGWARAGIKEVDLVDALLDDFLKTDTLAAAKRLVADLGMKVVSAASAVPDLWIARPTRAASLEIWKKRCEQFAELGAPSI